MRALKTNVKNWYRYNESIHLIIMAQLKEVLQLLKLIEVNLR